MSAVCGEEGCGRATRAHGLCGTHYHRQYYAANKDREAERARCPRCGRRGVQTEGQWRWCSACAWEAA